MIILTRIDGRQIIINAEEIEIIETSYDTTISLKDGKKYIVKESGEEIVEKVIEYKRKCFSELFSKIPKINNSSSEKGDL